VKTVFEVEGCTSSRELVGAVVETKSKSQAAAEELVGINLSGVPRHNNSLAFASTRSAAFTRCFSLTSDTTGTGSGS